MTRLAHLVLVLTAVAPVLFVLAATLAFEAPQIAGALALVVTLLVLAAWALLRAAARRVEHEPRILADVSTREREPLAFLVAYALPLALTGQGQGPLVAAPGVLLGVLAFSLVMTLVVLQLQLFYVNPLLAILGYHFFTGARDDGGQVLVVARRKTLPTGSLRVAVLSEYLWLEVKG